MARLPSIAEQRRRTDELDTLRLARKLTDEEAAEADRLADAAYMRTWRAKFRDTHGHTYFQHRDMAGGRS